jgi:hypothetical protein
VRQGGGHLAHGHQAARGFELFLLQCGQLLGALALADVEHRAHPAQLLPSAAVSGRFVDQHVHAVAAAVLELHLDALRPACPGMMTARCSSASSSAWSAGQ